MGASSSREDLPLSSKLTATEIVNRGIKASGVKDLSGKVYIVTGANVGIGKETARALVRGGGTVICACRNPEKGNAAVEELNDECPPADDAEPRAKFLKLDLGDFASISTFAEEFRKLNLPLHCLINNAGLMEAMLKEPRYTTQGFETTFGVNYVGPFYLTHLLLDQLKASAPSRVVILGSRGMNQVSLDDDFLDAYPMKEPPQEWGFRYAFTLYGRSKAMNAMHAMKLHRLYHDSGVTFLSLCPGPVKSELGDKAEVKALWQRVVRPLVDLILLPPDRGAANSVYCAVHPDAVQLSGRFLMDCKPTQVPPTVESEEQQDRLWDMSMQLLDLHAKSEQPGSSEPPLETS